MIGEFHLSRGLACLADKTLPNNKMQRTAARMSDMPYYFLAAADLERYTDDQWGEVTITKYDACFPCVTMSIAIIR